jgi:uncharacterized membrane protein
MLYDVGDQHGEHRMSHVTTETRMRTFARVISYRIAALLLTALIVGLKDAVVIHIWLTLLHYIVERIWLIVSWGRVPVKQL